MAPGARLRLAFICGGDPESVLTWSGTPSHMLGALRQEFDVDLVVRQPWNSRAQLARRAVRRLSRGAIDLAWVAPFRRYAAKAAVSQILASQCDAVIAVAVTPICAELVQHFPTIFVSDATLLAMVDYNPQFKALLPRFQHIAEKLESRCIQNAILALYPSQWAVRSAIADHGGHQDKVIQIPWGANTAAQYFTPPQQRSPTQWRLLFIGTNWAGKGGDLALETVKIMRARRCDVHIDIVGSAPSPIPNIIGVTFHGFLDKRIPAHKKQLDALYVKAHIFFLPTRFEALGIVFAEAASYAIPAVSYATGGVPAMVEDGVTGILLPEGAPAGEFANIIENLLSNRPMYIKMANEALSKSQTQLNWRTWAQHVQRNVEKQLNQICRNRPSR